MLYKLTVRHYSVAPPIAQTVVMPGLLSFFEVDRPSVVLIQWWEEVVLDMQKGEKIIRDGLL